MKELNNEQLKQVGELIGKEGRIVIIETKLDGMAQSRNFLVRNKDGKATIAGVVRPER